MVRKGKSIDRQIKSRSAGGDKSKKRGVDTNALEPRPKPKTSRAIKKGYGGGGNNNLSSDDNNNNLNSLDSLNSLNNDLSDVNINSDYRVEYEPDHVLEAFDRMYLRADARTRDNLAASSRCDIAWLVKDYIKPIMQALTMQVSEYNMGLVITKCLNTAVTFMILFFGTSALKETRYCDVRNVVFRHTGRHGANEEEVRSNGQVQKTVQKTMIPTKNSNQIQERNEKIIDDLARDLMQRRTRRYVYYIMMTDGKFVKTDANNKKSTVNFPGHVMVWEKIPSEDGGLPKYFIYQSYINEYDYSGSPGFRQIGGYTTYMQMARYLKTLMNFVTPSPVDQSKRNPWDLSMVALWKSLTGVDTSHMLGGRPHNAFFLCYRRRESSECLRRLHQFVRKTLRLIPSDPATMDAVFGDRNKYVDESNPLTNRAILSSFRELDQKLIAIRSAAIANAVSR